MNYELKKIDINMGEDVYLMYQDIPKEERGSRNDIKGLNIEDFKNKLKEYIKYEKEPEKNINVTTNRYVLFVDDIPVGEVGIRTTMSEYWLTKGSRIFFKIRLSERKKGYGTKILELALIEAKKLGMNQIRINCNDYNIASKKIILKNGGIIDIENYKTKEGTSSSYIITTK